MRIFYSVFGGLIVFFFLALGGWIFHEKVVLMIASYQFERAVAKLRVLVHKDAVTDLCQSSMVETDRLLGYQLRFVSSTEYEIESVCLSGDTAMVDEGSLFGGVTRLYGSGIMISFEGIESTHNGWVHLQYGKTVVASGYFSGILKTRWDVKDLAIGGDDVAEAQCSNWGFSCCRQDGERGEGSQVSTNDCLKQCFQSCNQSPLVLSFNTEPLLDPSDRSLVIHEAVSTITFGFQVADYDDGIGSVVLDFGDGQLSEALGESEDSVTHTYECRSSSCEFKPTLIVKDKAGIGLSDSRINVVHVRVEPR